MTVVVGVDASPRCHSAVRVAAQEARYRAVPLMAIMAYNTQGALGAAPAARPLSTLRTDADERAVSEAMLGDMVRDVLGAQAGDVDQRVVPGVAGRALVDAARRADASLVVLASRANGAMGWKIGASGWYVLRNAPCPVLVVPGDSKARA
jgi:nucleotide-binding universal stress UspA family protein